MSLAKLKKCMHRHRTRNVRVAVAHTVCINLAFTVLTVSASCFVTHVVRADDTAYAKPQQRIDIGNARHLNLYCIGSGTPTVVFESGLSDWSFSWALVQPQIGLLTRACVYDRAGLGYSDAARRAATSSNMVDDLHHLLRAAHLAPPYLLVGHSLGGLNVRLYADRFRDEVAGMVLVDPTHEDGIRRIDAQQDNRESRRYAAEIGRAKACLRRSRAVTADGVFGEQFRHDCIEPDDPHFSARLNTARVRVARLQSYQRAQLSEITHYANGTSFAEVRAARRWYGTLPLMVLTASRTVDAIGPEWLRLHRELATLSRLGVQCTVANSGHYIQRDQPQAVIAAVTNVLMQSRAISQVAPAAAAQFDYTATGAASIAPIPCPNSLINLTR